MDFGKLIDRRGTNSLKWDEMERYFGVAPDDGLPMWVADMDFPAPDFLQNAMQGLLDIGNYGYFSGVERYFQAVTWWMQTRHGWTVDPDHLFTTYGLGNAISMVIQAFSDPGDEVIVFTPVYHEFAAKIAKTGRNMRELPLTIGADGMYGMDFDDYETRLSGNEKIALFCSPHNPAGRVWTAQELQELAAFCERHNILIVSDEIHQDLTFSGHRHVPFPVAAPEAEERLIMLTSASKTFNIAGARTGSVAIPDAKLRATFGAFFNALDIKPNLLGITLSQAAYCADGGAWVDKLTDYLADNAALFINGLNAIPGVAAMPMQSTYLAWVDFESTGMPVQEVQARLTQDAKIAPTPGLPLGLGGERFMRFNLAMPRTQIETAVDRIQTAFGDLQ